MKGESKIHVAVSNAEIFTNSNRFGTRKRRSMKVIRKLIPLLNDIQIRNNNGRPKSRPWADDTKYHTFLVLTYISFYNRHIRAQIRERSSSNTKPKQGRPNIFLYQDDKEVRSSGVVERFFGWLKSFRRIQTRYERLASTTCIGFIQLGCIIMILMRLFR